MGFSNILPEIFSFTYFGILIRKSKMKNIDIQFDIILIYAI